MRRSSVAVVLGALLVPAVAHAAPILGSDSDLATIATSYERQQDTFARAESGMNFDANIKNAERATVEGFFAQDKDFETYAGKSVFEVMDSFDEHGDMGNFSGIASVGLAARLMVLKRDGAPAAEIDRARAAAVRAARTWHVFGTIAGPDTVARGVRRIVPESGSTALPGTTPALVPLKDSGGNPQPPSKTDTWRAPVASGYSEWIWRDNTSKDQVAGYALGALYLYDALYQDTAVPKDVTADLAADLVRFAKNLMKQNGPQGVDLCVIDADGRPTSFGDLNSRLVNGTGGIVLGEDSSLQNGFNAALALGIVRAALYVSDDPVLRAYYYDDLVDKRGYPGHAVKTATLMYQNEGTNFSNVNMLAIALATIGRVESEPRVVGPLRDLIDKFWDPGSQSRAAVNTQQPWYDVIVAGFGRAPKAEVPGRMKSNLLGYPLAPTFQRDRVNCDDTEIANGSCLAVDGTTTITLSSGKGWGSSVVANAIVPLAVRPDTNFLWRSDPFGVNGTGGDRLNPRGDWLAAYWLGRLLDQDPSKNVVKKSVSTPVGDGGASDVDGGTASSSSSSSGGSAGGGDSADGGDAGCRCRSAPVTFGAGPAMFVTALALALARLRRRMRRRL